MPPPSYDLRPAQTHYEPEDPEELVRASGKMALLDNVLPKLRDAGAPAPHFLACWFMGLGCQVCRRPARAPSRSAVLVRFPERAHFLLRVSISLWLCTTHAHMCERCVHSPAAHTVRTTPGHRVLLFSQMTRTLDIIEDFLHLRDFKFALPACRPCMP